MDDPNEILTTQLTLLTRPQAYLRRLGIRDVAQQRQELTWHPHTLPSHWASTIGMWGGVMPHAEIMKRADVSYVTMNMFRQRNALMTRPTREQWDLAASAFLRWKLDKEDVRQVPAIASHFGVLPIELRIYVDRMKLVVTELELQDAELFEPDQYVRVKEAWTAHGEAIDAFVVSTYAQL